VVKVRCVGQVRGPPSKLTRVLTIFQLDHAFLDGLVGGSDSFVHIYFKDFFAELVLAFVKVNNCLVVPVDLVNEFSAGDGQVVLLHLFDSGPHFEFYLGHVFRLRSLEVVEQFGGDVLETFEGGEVLVHCDFYLVAELHLLPSQMHLLHGALQQLGKRLH
jgi:hypothetical protein